jgi:uncharacterized protein (TIRG00374 family)
VNRFADHVAEVRPWLRRGGLLILTVLAVEYLVLPKVIGAGDDLSLLASAETGLLGAAVLLETSSLICYSLLTRATLPPDAPGLWTLARVDLTGYGVSHVVPGGGATAAAFRFRLMTRAGVRPEDILSGAAVQAAAEVITLVALFVVGVALSLPTDEVAFVTAGGVALALLLAVMVAAALLTRRRDRTLVQVHRLVSRWPSRVGRTLEETVSVLTDRLEVLAHDRVLLARTLGWAAANWSLDTACLWCCLRAYGYVAPVGPVLAVYGAVCLLAMLPFTPAGLGVVEGVLVPVLVSLGAPSAVALLGVLTWRLLQFWLPVPLALLTYLSLQLGTFRYTDPHHEARSPSGPPPSQAQSGAQRPPVPPR